MAAKLTFNSIEELASFFGSKEGLIKNSKQILESVAEGYAKNISVVELFSIDLYEEEAEISIKLEKSQWEVALRSCLEYFEEYELSDESIDTYLLLKKIAQ